MTDVIRTGQGARPETARRAFRALFVLILLIGLVPLALHPYPAMQDYPNHLARLHILTSTLPDGWQKFYLVNGSFQPNLALDLICAELVRSGLGPNDALRLFAALAYLLLSVGTVLLAGEGLANPPWLALWAPTIVLSRYFMWGFVNYFFALGLGLLGVYAWSRMARVPGTGARLVQVLGTCLLLVLLMVSHMMGWGFCVMLIGLRELANIRDAQSARRVAAQLCLLAAAAVPSVLVYALGFKHGVALPVYSDVIRGKLSGLISPFLAYSAPIAGLIAASLLAGCIIVYRMGSAAAPSWRPHVMLPLIGVLLLFLVAPPELLGSAFVDRRMFLLAALLALGIPQRMLEPAAWRLLACCAVGAMLVKVVEIQVAWSAQDQAVSELRTAWKDLPVNPSLGEFNFTPTGQMSYPTLLHASAYAVIDKAAYIPSLFAEPKTRESISYVDPAAQPVIRGMGSNSTSAAQVDWTAACARFDFVLVTFTETDPAGTPGCLELFRQGRYFRLYRSLGRVGTEGSRS